MFTGKSPLPTLFPRLPNADAPATNAVRLNGVEWLQFSFEAAGADPEALFPPALHPTLPVLLQFAAFAVAESPWGAFNACLLRLTCRSGARPRTMLVSAVVDAPGARAALESGWGFNVRAGDVLIERSYDSASVTVFEGDEPTLALTAADPEPLAPGDLQFFSSMHAAQLERGPRLLQADLHVDVLRAERYQPWLERFDALAFGAAALEPGTPVAAFGAHVELELGPVRFACRPDELAFTGTERLGPPAG
jgi:hypothetical protein